MEQGWISQDGDSGRVGFLNTLGVTHIVLRYRDLNRCLSSNSCGSLGSPEAPVMGNVEGGEVEGSEQKLGTTKSSDGV